MVHQDRIEPMMEAPTAAVLVHIKREIGEDDDRLKNTEELLFRWIECQTHFPKNYDKIVVRNFLRGSKHNLETAKRRLENHFAVKAIYPEIFSGRCPSSKEVVNTLKVMNMVILPKLTKEGYRITIFRINDQDAYTLDLALTFKVLFMIYEVALRSPHPVAGDITIFDNENVTASHVVKCFSPLLRSMIKVLREAYSIRLKRMHVVNCSAKIDQLLSFVKPLLHHKVRNNILIHEDGRTLHDLYSDILPSNYGGKEKSLTQLQNDWMEELNKNSEWLEESETVKITGPKPKEFEASFGLKEQIGLDGCFRKLEID